MFTKWFWSKPFISFGFIHSVAPNSIANLNLLGLTSIAIIRSALLNEHPCTHARPTPPRPKTAQVELLSTNLLAAQNPVVNPQPSKQILSGGASFLTFAQLISKTTEYSLKVDVPIK
eukprot:NODE_505_length_7533_cov_0.471886.p8 type:complete len:117 gc:universal NODE_505_length_7533_cov_0.471886:3777-4127(+)